MDQDTLVEEQIKAGTWFLGEFQKYCPVQCAFWLKQSEDSYWYLYVASDQITDDNFDLAYGELARIAAASKNPWFDPFRIKVIGTDDPLAKSVIDLQHRYPMDAPTRFPPRTLAGVSVDDLYVYPTPVTATA